MFFIQRAAILIAMTALCAVSTALAQAPGLPKDQGDRYAGAPHATRSPVMGANGMAATSHPLATQVALDILKAGGSAVDAAIAANAAQGLMEPTGNGIGGDLFALVWDPKTGRLHGLNASGRAPMGQTREALLAANGGKPLLPPHGWLPVTIPGAVDGWFMLHARFGRLPMATNLAPAIGYAEAGHPVAPYIAGLWASSVERFGASARAGMLGEAANMMRVYAPGGRAPAAGEMFKNPDLARSLRAIAEAGRDGFYKGALAQAMDGYFRRIGAPHRLADLEAHAGEWIEPIATDYRGHRVHQIPPPGQGLTTLILLNLLEGFDLKAMGRGSADFWHVFIEAKKLAFADRAAWIGDVPGLPTERLLGKDYAQRRRGRIAMERAAQSAEPGIPPTGPSTIYLTVADKDGMMVSLIQSNYRGMGSGLVPDDGAGGTLGFMLQDRGQQFDLRSGQPNSYAPGKRPFHTIIPAFVTKAGRPWLSFGVMGGDTQPQGQALILINMIDFAMNVQEAGDAARITHGGSTEPDGTAPMLDGGMLVVESGVPAAVVAELERRGHRIGAPAAVHGGYQAIWRDPASGVYWGASDFRKDGQAAGW